MYKGEVLYMKTKHGIAIIIFLLSVSLCSCFKDTDNLKNTTSEIDSHFREDKLQYTNIIGDTELAQSIFKEELDLKNINNHIFYYSPGQYNFVISFNSSVTGVEIDSFMSYFSRLFISMHPSSIAEFPYESQLIMGKNSILESKDEPYEKLSLRVYIDDVKAFRYDYTFKNLKLASCEYWENIYKDHNFKALKTESTEAFIKNNKSLGKTINIRKTFKNDGVIIVKIKGNRRFSDRYMKKMKEAIEYNLAPALEKEAIAKYNTNFQYLGLVLQFQDKNSMYQEYVYYNGKDEDKGWVNVNWMEYKFLSNYIQN